MEKFNNMYTDWNDEYTELTQKEIGWFNSIVEKFKMLPEANGIEITNRNHDELDGKHKEALGIFYTYDPMDSTINCLITIDNYFIHEQYEKIFNNCHTIESETIESVLSHEIAHRFKFRHCKKHTILTQKILNKYNELNKTIA